MVFVWGHKGYHDLLGYIIWECPECKTTGVFAVEQVRKKFTVYFVPTFSYSQKQFLTCTACQAVFEVPKELKPEVAKHLMSQEEISSLIRQVNEEAAESEKQIEASPRESSLVDEQRVMKNSIRYCPSCGNKVTKKAAYCIQCGTKLEK